MRAFNMNQSSPPAGQTPRPGDGGEAPTVVAERLDAGLQCERGLAQGRVDLEPVVRGIRLGKAREAAVVPGELAAVHDPAAYGGPVPPYKLRRRVDHDVRPVRERVDEV